MTTPPSSLRCRHCRADNDPGATACWLCGAPDWGPAASGPPAAKAAAETARFPRRTTVGLGLLMIATFLLVYVVSHYHIELAVMVSLVWLVPGAVYLWWRRVEPIQTLIALVLAVVLAVALAVVVGISAVVFLYIVCAVGSGRGFR